MSDRSLARKVQPARVLVADDSPVIREYMSELLEELGHQILLANNGEEAFRFASEKLPDIVLLDIIMPEMNGFEVCEKLKNQEKTRLIPVVLITTLNEQEDKIRGLEAGADDFLTKPVDESELMARIRNLIRLHHYGKELETANARIRQAEDARKTLTSFLADDLRTYVESVDSNLEQLTKQVPSTASDILMQSRVTCMEATRLLSDLEASQKLENLEFPINKGAVGLPDIAEVAAATMQGILKKRSLTVKKHLADIPAVNADQHLTERLISNLLSTAAAVSRPGQEITIITGTEKEKGEAFLRILDTGPLEDASGDRQVTAAARRRGMSLRFCRLAAEAQGGRLTAGRHGEQSLTTLHLPLHTEEEVEAPFFGSSEDVPAFADGGDE